MTGSFLAIVYFFWQFYGKVLFRETCDAFLTTLITSYCRSLKEDAMNFDENMKILENDLKFEF